jgi:Thioesterase-like superfamily
MADEQAIGTGAASGFDLATAVRHGPDAWSAVVDPGWGFADRPNGGYLLALVTRAALAALERPHPLAVSAHFVSPPEAGPAELAVVPLRAGRSLATARVGLVQDGRPRLEALVTAGRLDPAAAPGWQAPGGPALPPVAACLPAEPQPPGGVRVGLLDHLDLRLDPATAGWFRGRPGGRLEMRGWVRFRDGRQPDALALVQAVDALPPTSLEIGLPGWAPTVELTVLVRGLPAAGWLACTVSGRLWQDGWFDEEAEVWDERGRLVAQSRQLAGARPPRPS